MRKKPCQLVTGEIDDFLTDWRLLGLSRFIGLFLSSVVLALATRTFCGLLRWFGTLASLLFSIQLCGGRKFDPLVCLLEKDDKFCLVDNAILVRVKKVEYFIVRQLLAHLVVPDYFQRLDAQIFQFSSHFFRRLVSEADRQIRCPAQPGVHSPHPHLKLLGFGCEEGLEILPETIIDVCAETLYLLPRGSDVLLRSSDHLVRLVREFRHIWGGHGSGLHSEWLHLLFDLGHVLISSIDSFSGLFHLLLHIPLHLL
mmetsp:Transcript_29422/g.77782  ORF Transcript_29422/g.77782 Transcript_29422/m.77782 type:complete len:255 (-) Transcript_29422:260-1024(-)